MIVNVGRLLERDIFDKLLTAWVAVIATAYEVALKLSYCSLKLGSSLEIESVDFLHDKNVILLTIYV